MIVEKHYENPQICHENTMPCHAYFIPAQKHMGDLVPDREKSGRFQLLSGEWEFCYYPSICELEEADIHAQIRKDAGRFVPVQVPGTWQGYGYDRYQYTNYRYPFPVDPPFVPAENPCGIYVKRFQYHRNARAPLAFLNFEGVDSCFYVWMNETYVGYSQVSHSTSEFHVTGFLQEGENVLKVLVLKWCDGSYLEDQDKFRTSGIFRDVYLLNRPESGLYDYHIHTRIKDDGNAEIRIRTECYGSLPAGSLYKFQLHAPEGKISAEPTGRPARVRQEQGLSCGTNYSVMGDLMVEDLMIEVPNPHLWNPEDPCLYTLVMTGRDEVIVERIGIREISIRNNVVMLNGVPVTFHGVNRHEWDPVTGPVVSLSQMKKDLTLIRRHNFNAIRTSHYPDVPVFYQLCDEYGLMVIDEADLEAHGPVARYFENSAMRPEERWNEVIADNPLFTEAVGDRIRRLVMRDKNRPCILIWSMGNESGYGCNFEEALRWVKSYDPDRLTHYESALYKREGHTYDYSDLDLYSRMYPSLEEMEAYVAGKPDKPLILCEYAHAMGNGPGDLEDYFEMIEKHDEICGGFVWEWCDHAVWKGTVEKGFHCGEDIYYYGGDHGESLHDGNFCMDGLVYPDRRPHTGLLEYQNVYRPARAAYDQAKNRLTLSNKMMFTKLGEYLDLRYALEQDGDLLLKGEIPGEMLPEIGPGQQGNLILPVKIPSSGRCYLKVFYYKKREEPWMEKGYYLGFDEIPLQVNDARNGWIDRYREWIKEESKEYRDHGKKGYEILETNRYLTISNDLYRFRYDKQTGLFTEIYAGRESLLREPMKISLWRAPTDNDRYRKGEWIRAGYDRTYSRAYCTEWKYVQNPEEQDMQRGSVVEIRSSLGIFADGIQRIMKIDLLWRILEEGSLHVEMNVEKDREFPELPRFGIRMILTDDMQFLEYYGMGPTESYVDKHQAAGHGRYLQPVAGLHENYIRPQENGSHLDCDYLLLRGEDKNIDMFVYGEQPFSFQASRYTEEELTKKGHSYELVPSGGTVLHLDYCQNGIGSNSCGPELAEKYRFTEERFRFSLTICFHYGEPVLCLQNHQIPVE